MPFLGGNGGTFDAVSAERVYLSDIAGSTDEVTVYVNSDQGDDNNSGYDPAFPLRTVARAGQELPALALTSKVTIRLEGAAPHQLPDGYLLPPVFRGVRLDTDFSDVDGFSLRGPVRIYSPAVELLLIGVGDVVGQVFPDNSGLLTLQTSLVLVPGALVGKWIVDSLGNIAQIADNTAADIDLCYFGAMAPPCRVLSYGAVLENATPGFFATLGIRGGTSPIILQGLQIQGGGFGFFPSLEAAQGQPVFVQACNLEGLWVNQELGIPSSVQVHATRLERNVAPGGGDLIFSNCLLAKVAWALVSPASRVTVQQCVSDLGGDPLIFDTNFNAASPGSLVIAVSRILNGATGGIKMGGPGVFALSNLFVDSNTGVAVVCDGSCSGRVIDVQGQLNNGGLSARNGAQVEVSNSTNVNLGDGDELRVGSVFYLWANLRPAPLNLFDIAIPAGELARVYQP